MRQQTEFEKRGPQLARYGGPIVAHTAGLTAVAMLAFAANSLLCREALGHHLIDAASFSTARVITGAATLGLIALFRGRTSTGTTTDWRAAVMLFIYMVFFSFAYISLSAGTGAVILFGAIQFTLFFLAWRAGERLSSLSWAGIVVALSGLIYMVLPGVTAPSPLGAVLMVIAGIAWGFYSLLGKGASDPLRSTAKNFIYAVPLVLGVSAVFAPDFNCTSTGFMLAALAGAIASGCGYVFWYAALRGLSATQAAIVQLSVPALAACGGVILLSEPVTMRLVLASAAMLGGIAIVVTQRTTRPRSS